MDTNGEPSVGGGDLVNDHYAVACSQLYIYFNLHDRRREQETGKVYPIRQTMLHLTPAPDKVTILYPNGYWGIFDFSDDLRAKAALTAVGLMPPEVFADALQDEHSSLEGVAVEIRNCEAMYRYGGGQCKLL